MTQITEISISKKDNIISIFCDDENCHIDRFDIVFTRNDAATKTYDNPNQLFDILWDLMIASKV